VADEQVAFEIEYIPLSDVVYLRAYRGRVQGTTPRPSAFQPHGNGHLSVDWSKYSSPEQTLARAKSPKDNAVLKLEVTDVREFGKGLDVTHVPLSDNRAHSELNLPTDNVEQTEVRLKLSRIATVVIQTTS
jgi:hypothetical protein